MPVEWLVHRQTRQTAEMYGLHDRGLLAPGMRADVNVIDLDGLAVELPHLVDDLPTGAKRYVQRAEGYGAPCAAVPSPCSTISSPARHRVV